MAVGFTKARLQWKALDEKLAPDLEAMSKLGDGDATVISTDRRNKTWLVALDNDDGPPRFFSFDRKSKQGTFLFTSRPDLEDVQLAEMKPVSYPARDGLTIHGYLTLPPKVPAKGLPAVIYPHGGPWARDNWGFEPTAQWLANRGYAVLQPNFRGSTGYGKKFLNAANREWGGKMQDDVTDGTKWLIDQGIVDAKRVCIMGGSYGGYATLMGLAKEPSLYACGVDIVGVANLITWINTIPPYWMPFQHVLHQRVGHPEKDAAFLKSRSPVFLTDKIRAPLLIGQGANDPRVPRNESIQNPRRAQEGRQAGRVHRVPGRGPRLRPPREPAQVLRHGRGLPRPPPGRPSREVGARARSQTKQTVDGRQETGNREQEMGALIPRPGRFLFPAPCFLFPVSCLFWRRFSPAPARQVRAGGRYSGSVTRRIRWIRRLLAPRPVGDVQVAGRLGDVESLDGEQLADQRIRRRPSSRRCRRPRWW